MNKLVSAFAFAGLACTTAPAFAEPVTLVRDGITYRYTVTEKAGTRIITGAQHRGERFRLIVRNGWVSGQVGARTVSFREADATPARPAPIVETAAR